MHAPWFIWHPFRKNYEENMQTKAIFLLGILVSDPMVSFDYPRLLVNQNPLVISYFDDQVLSLASVFCDLRSGILPGQKNKSSTRPPSYTPMTWGKTEHHPSLILSSSTQKYIKEEYWFYIYLLAFKYYSMWQTSYIRSLEQLIGSNSSLASFS